MRHLTAAVITAAALAVAGCSSGSHQPTKAENLYALAVQQADPDDIGPQMSTDMVNTLASEGHSICDLFESGQSMRDALARERLGFGDKEAAALVGATAVLCPDQAGKLKAAG